MTDTAPITMGKIILMAEEQRKALSIDALRRNAFDKVIRDNIGFITPEHAYD